MTKSHTILFTFYLLEICNFILIQLRKTFQFDLKKIIDRLSASISLWKTCQTVAQNYGLCGSKHA